MKCKKCDISANRRILKMKCEKCGISANERILQRINKVGEIGIFWCEPCIKEVYPEKHREIVNNRPALEQILIDINYPKKE